MGRKPLDAVWYEPEPHWGCPNCESPEWSTVSGHKRAADGFAPHFGDGRLVQCQGDCGTIYLMPGHALRGGEDDCEFVRVPQDLAKRIRLTLDHGHRDDWARVDENDEHHGNRLATDLVNCQGYPLHREPWDPEEGGVR